MNATIDIDYPGGRVRLEGTIISGRPIEAVECPTAIDMRQLRLEFQTNAVNAALLRCLGPDAGYAARWWSYIRLRNPRRTWVMSATIGIDGPGGRVRLPGAIGTDGPIEPVECASAGDMWKLRLEFATASASVKLLRTLGYEVRYVGWP